MLSRIEPTLRQRTFLYQKESTTSSTLSLSVRSNTRHCPSLDLVTSRNMRSFSRVAEFSPKPKSTPTRAYETRGLVCVCVCTARQHCYPCLSFVVVVPGLVCLPIQSTTRRADPTDRDDDDDGNGVDNIPNHASRGTISSHLHDGGTSGSPGRDPKV